MRGQAAMKSVATQEELEVLTVGRSLSIASGLGNDRKFETADPCVIVI